MTTLLKRAFEAAEQQSPEVQDSIASLVLEELQDENDWDALFARDVSLMDDLAEKTRKDASYP